MAQTVNISTAGVPSTFCFTSWQQSWGELVSLLTGTLSGGATTFNFGATTPTAENRDKPWFRLDPISGAPDRWYYFWNGSWVSPSYPYDANERRIFVGTPAQVWAYDGGSGVDPSVNPPTETTGAMWKIDTNMAARMPIGVGTTPGGTVIPEQGSGGTDVMIAGQVPEHQHYLFADEVSGTTITGGSTRAATRGGNYGGSQDDKYQIGEGTVSAVANTGLSGKAGAVTPSSFLPPWYGVYYIMRTARQFYTV